MIVAPSERAVLWVAWKLGWVPRRVSLRGPLSDRLRVVEVLEWDIPVEDEGRVYVLGWKRLSPRERNSVRRAKKLGSEIVWL